MGKSAFERLPPEIRNHIVELALFQAEPIKIYRRVLRHWHWLRRYGIGSSHIGSHPTALIMTCRSMREEGQEVSVMIRLQARIFYAINSFEFPCKTDQLWNNSIQLLHDFVSQIGPRNASALRSIVVDIKKHSYKSQYYDDGPPPPRISRERKPDIQLPHCSLRVKLPMCKHTSSAPDFPLLSLESDLQAEIDAVAARIQQMEEDPAEEDWEWNTRLGNDRAMLDHLRWIRMGLFQVYDGDQMGDHELVDDGTGTQKWRRSQNAGALDVLEGYIEWVAGAWRDD
ncbi:hypothetical protein LTR17_002322 [Elasticomyces elasticus]|nr:hypothetical protein LTR17_002322 [Elasticomyces elasticus]